jgi:copper chaperone CopZ
MQFSELIWDDDRAGLAVHCRAARHPGMFPLLEARFELAPLPSGRRHLTQVGLVGRYQPPLGVLGDLADRLGGSGIAVESVRRFVEDVARRLETVFTRERPRSDEDEPTTDITREPGRSGLKKILLMVERLATRPGGAVGAARRLAAIPGVVSVDIDPDTTLAEVHYDPARCHASDLVDDLEDDEILGFTEAG